MKRLSFIAVILLSLSITASCTTIKGNGNITKDNRNITGFNNVTLNGSIDVVISYAEQHSVVVECESNFLEYIFTEVKNGTLEIRTKENISLRPSINNGKPFPIAVHVTMPVVEDITLKGSGDIYVWNNMIFGDKSSLTLIGSGDINCKNLSTKNCSLYLNGSGDLDVDNLHSIDATINLVGSGDLAVNYIDSENTIIGLNGSGDIKTKGKCKNLNLKLEGSGDLETNIDYESCDVSLFGSGDIDVKKCGKLNIASKSGSGDIHIK